MHRKRKLNPSTALRVDACVMHFRTDGLDIRPAEMQREARYRVHIMDGRQFRREPECLRKVNVT